MSFLRPKNDYTLSSDGAREFWDCVRERENELAAGGSTETVSALGEKLKGVFPGYRKIIEFEYCIETEDAAASDGKKEPNEIILFTGSDVSLAKAAEEFAKTAPDGWRVRTEF